MGPVGTRSSSSFFSAFCIMLGVFPASRSRLMSTMTVFASNGVTQIATTSYPPLSFTATAGGIYYLRLKPYSFSAASTNSYTFTIQ